MCVCVFLARWINRRYFQPWLDSQLARVSGFLTVDMLDSAQPTNLIVFFFFPPLRRPGASLVTTAKQVPPVWQVGCDSSKMLYDLRGRENNINGNSPSNTLTGMNRVPPSPSKWTCIDRRNPWINLALIDFFFLSSPEKKKSLILNRDGESCRMHEHLSFCINLWATHLEEQLYMRLREIQCLPATSGSRNTQSFIVRFDKNP